MKRATAVNLTTIALFVFMLIQSRVLDANRFSFKFVVY
jgi:hypothetical protein